MNTLFHFLVVKEGKSKFDNTTDAVIEKLKAHDNITVDKKKKIIKYEAGVDQITLSYEIIFHQVTDVQDKSFDIIIKSKEFGEDEYNNLNKISDVILESLKRIGGGAQVTVLWNEIQRKYSFKAYQLIFDIENILRKFIYQLMAYKIGYGWIEAVVPDGIETRNSERMSNQSNFLHEIYLTDLTKIIFKGQRDIKFRTLTDIDRFVRRKINDKVKEIPMSELEGMISESIWNKYFKDKSVKSDDLEDRLKTLANLRNQVAHNKFLSRSQLGQIESLSSRIKKDIEQANKKLDSVEFTNNDKEFTADIVEKVNDKYSGITEKSALDRFFESIKSNIQWVTLEPNSSRLDAIFLDKDDKKIAVEARRSIRDIEEARRVVTQLLKSANDQDCDECILIISSYTHVADLENKINDIMRKEQTALYMPIWIEVQNLKFTISLKTLELLKGVSNLNMTPKDLKKPK